MLTVLLQAFVIITNVRSERDTYSDVRLGKALLGEGIPLEVEVMPRRGSAEGGMWGTKARTRSWFHPHRTPVRAQLLRGFSLES